MQFALLRLRCLERPTVELASSAANEEQKQDKHTLALVNIIFYIIVVFGGTRAIPSRPHCVSLSLSWEAVPRTLICPSKISLSDRMK